MKKRPAVVWLLVVFSLAECRKAIAQEPREPPQSVVSILRNSSDEDARCEAVLSYINSSRRLPASAVPVLVEALYDQNGDISFAAAEGLGKVGTAAVPELAVALQSKRPSDQYLAANALAYIGPAAQGAVDGLTELLEDSRDYEIRKAALFALGEIGPGGDQSIPAIIASLRDENEQVRYYAVSTLGYVGAGNRRAVETLLELIRSDDQYMRCLALDALPWTGAHARAAIPALSGLLDSEDNTIRVAAAESLWRIDSGNRKALDALVEEAMKGDTQDSRMAGAGLRASAQPEKVIPRLIKMIEEGDTTAKVHAARILSAFGCESRAAVSVLIDVLVHEDDKLVVAAARTLGAIGPQAEDAVPALTELLTQPNKSTGYPSPRNTALIALADIGQASGVAVSTLLDLLNDPAQSVLFRRSVIETLGSIGPAAQTAVPDLVHTLDNAELRANAAEALGRIGAASKEALPALRKALRDWELSESFPVVVALARIDPMRNRNAVRELINLIADPDADGAEYLEAIEVLGEIGPHGRKALPALHRIMRQRHPYDRIRAAIAVRRLSPQDDRPTRTLLDIIHDRHAPFRDTALVAFAAMCPHQDTLVPILKNMLQDRDELMRVEAAKLLRRMSEEDGCTAALPEPATLSKLPKD